jgi:hypothetical protein
LHGFCSEIKLVSALRKFSRERGVSDKQRKPPSLEGGCACRKVRYRLRARPLVVHCCHCTWCQRESGSAFAVNALIETDRVQLTRGEPEPVRVPSSSGKGQVILRCPQCRIALWSHYAGAGQSFCFVRVGSLDTPQSAPPDIHIYTESKQPWVVIPPDQPSVSAYYRASDYWPGASLERLRRLKSTSRPD